MILRGFTTFDSKGRERLTVVTWYPPGRPPPQCRCSGRKR